MRIVAFDFKNHTDSVLQVDGLASPPDPSLYYWVDLAATVGPEADDLLARFGVPPDAARASCDSEQESFYDIHDTCIHCTLCECRQQDGRLATAPVHILLGEHYLIMRHRTPIHFVDQVGRMYHEDFVRYAKSPGFLLFELYDQLLAGYRRAYLHFGHAVKQVQLNLFGTVDDDIFRQVSDLTTDLLGFRGIVLTARDLLHHFATRRSPFVNETTQAHLGTMAEALERMGADITAEREALHETLNLYMGMVSHRTNRVINRLTVLSMIFLPLTFICGVYGMNFEVMPELAWPWSYPIFWLGALLFIGLSIHHMRRRKWI